MLEHGNKVRIDTSACEMPDCVNGHPPKHRTYDRAIGTFHYDIREHREHEGCKVFEDVDNSLRCPECGIRREETWGSFVGTHYMIVGFPDDFEKLFTPDELEDLGSDYFQKVFDTQAKLGGVFDAVPVTRTPH